MNSGRKNLTLRGGGGSGDVAMAKQIMVGVRRAGLPLKLDKITPGDDNCFFHAVFAQCQRPSVAQELSGEPVIRDNHDLRLKIARFARNSRLPLIQSFKKRYEESHPADSWDGFWKTMAEDRVWADAITLQGAAWYLHHDIHVVMASATEKKPLCTFSGSWVTEGARCDKTPLLLGYLNDLHYQSLLPCEEDLFRPATFQPMSFKEIMDVSLQVCQTGELKRKKDEAERPMEEISHKKSKQYDGKTNEEHWDFNFSWSGKGLTIKPLPEGGWTCPYCESEEKQIMRHIKTKHLPSSDRKHFEDIEKAFRKHTKNKSDHAIRMKKMEEDPEAVRKKHRDVDKLCRERRMEEKPEVVRKKHREVEKESRERRIEEKPEVVRKRHREVEKDSRERRIEKNPEVKKKHSEVERIRKIARKGSRAAAIIDFFKEILYGPDFPCESCEGLFFRHQVVEINGPTQTQIRKKARDAQIRDYNSTVQQVHNSYKTISNISHEM